MTYKGHIENGVVVLDEPAELPDGTEVSVTPGQPVALEEKAQPSERTWAEQLAPFVGCLDDLPSDFAENHDHYLYGVPEKA